MGKRLPVGTPLRTMLTVPGQLSVAVPVPRSASAMTTPACVEAGPVTRLRLGGELSAGDSASTTVTCCMAVAVLPAGSVAVHVTDVVPSGKMAGALFVTVTVPELSEAVAVPSPGDAAQVPDEVVTATSAGAVIVGGIASASVVNDQLNGQIGRASGRERVGWVGGGGG